MLDLHFVQELPESVPKELGVYSTLRPSVSQRKLIAMGRQLQLSLPEGRPEFRYVDNWMIARHGAFTLAVQRQSGALRFRDELRYGRDFETPFELSDERAIMISRAFLDRSHLVNGDNRELEVAKVTHLRGHGASIEGEEAPEEILDAGVIFTREIEGIPVRGFGGFVMINVGADESVIGGTKIWRHRAKKIEVAEVLPPEVALERFERRLKKRQFDGPIRVVKAEFCYFERDDHRAQKFLEPTYAFVFETQLGQFPYKSIEVIPGTRRPRQRWTFRKRFQVPDTGPRSETVH